MDDPLFETWVLRQQTKFLGLLSIAFFLSTLLALAIR
jgi:hypothetical protein